MPDYLYSPSFIWFLIGFAFLLAELGAPGFILIFFGFGAWVAAFAAWLFGIGLDLQITVFLVSSILFLVALRRLSMRIFTGRSDGVSDDLSDQPSNVGAVVEVTKTITQGALGEVKYRGTFWRALADETIEAGVSAVIIDEFKEDRSTFKVGPYNG